MKKAINGLSLIFIFIALSACNNNSPSSKLNSLINKAIRSNNDVNETEWKEMKDYVLSKKDKLKEYITPNGQADANKLQQLILTTAAKRRNNTTNPDIFKEKNLSETATRSYFNIYIENSRSMDGYVKGNTNFEAAITRLLVDISNYAQDDKKIHINFINSKIFPALEVDIRNVAAKLEPNSKTYDVGGKARGVSDLNQVFRMVLDSTQSEIAILISDCIYSLGKNSDTEGTLNIQKSLTMKAFLDKLRNTDIATICLKLVSEFNGPYYDKNNKPTELYNTQRPYYIWLMGPKNKLEDFYKTINPQTDLSGYKNSFVLFPTAADKTPFYTVLKETGKVGSFKSDRSNRDFVHSINDIGYKDNVLQFTLAVDLGKIPVDTGYLLDKVNFKLTEGYTLTEIKPFNRNIVSARDRVALDNTAATHLLTVKTTKDYSLQDLQISVLRQVPGWVQETHGADDSNIKSASEATKTFGLKHLIQGVNDAYKEHDPAQQSFFTFIITIKK
jgi:hypothetical protein